MDERSEGAKSAWARLWGLLNTPIFAGLVVALVVAIAGLNAVHHDANSSTTVGNSGPGGLIGPGSESRPRGLLAEPDKDGDGVPDEDDDCPGNPGIKPSGCPDGDGDGVINEVDRCLKVQALTDDGCPEAPRVTSLASMIVNGDREFGYEENTATTEVTVGGVTESLGVVMSLGTYLGEFSIPTNREFQAIRGRVGITSTPCSEGSDARVAIRDAEGRQLWPKGSGPMPVDRDAEPFKTRISSEDAIVLYAEGSEGSGSCGTYPDSTKVGWVRLQLIQ